MSDAYLRFWGVRGSYSAPFESHLGVGGNTSCVEVRADDNVLICDAGSGIIPLGNELMAQKEIRNLLIILTHYHWDHICGLPFFVPAFVPDWNINFFGPGQCDDEIKEHVSAQMQAPYFPVGTETWLANINYLQPTRNQVLNQGPVPFEYYNVHHPGTTYGYKINVRGKTIHYISDNECSYLGKSIDKNVDELTTEEKQLHSDMKREEHLAEVEMVRNADILIHDAQYTPEDYEKKRGWGHSCYIDTVNIAIEAGVKELYLYHHDPNYDDDAMEKIHQHSLSIIKEKNSALKCHIAREGLKVDLS